MREDLVLMAWSSQVACNHFRDKYLDGYSTIQFVSAIHQGLYVAYDDRRYDLTSGDWFFPAYPGPRFRFFPLTASAHWHHRHVAFQGPLVDSWRAAGLWLTQPQAAPPHHDWARHFDELVELFKRSDRVGRLRAINGIEGLLLQLAEARAEGTPQPWLQEVLRLLDAAGDEQPVLERIAAQIGWSSTELRRRFKRATGLTMREHVQQGRVARARTLLSDTDMPLKAIAREIGYANEFIFSRQFKERTGVAPGAWRKSR